MSNFGEYITKEYGVLKKILKNLSFHDLLVARIVCRDWFKAVDRILLNEFKNTPEIFFAENADTTKEEEEFWNETVSVPEVLIKYCAYEPSNKPSASSDIELLWAPIFDHGLCEVSKTEEDAIDKWKAQSSCKISPIILHLGCDGSFGYFSKNRYEPMDHLHSSFFDSGASSTISLPKANGVHYSVFSLSLKNFDRKKQFNLEELENYKDKGPVRCILLYDCSYNKYRVSFEWFLRHLFNAVNSQQNTEFAFGGGKVNTLSWWQNNNQKKPDVCGVIIRGENVVAISNVVEECFTTDDLDSFFEDLAKDAGPLPEGASRVALMAQCIDRPQAFKRIYRFPEVDAEILETHHFTKYFPNVPICGFLAGGEYGKKAVSNVEVDADESSKSKRSKKNPIDVRFDLMHWQSSSIVLLTYLNAVK